MKGSTARIASLALIIISIMLIYLLYTASVVSVIIRAVLAIAILIGVGWTIQRLLGFKGGYGFYMLGSKGGLSTIDRISKNYGSFWDVMSLWGLTLGFGILTYPLLKGKIDKRVYASGLITLFLIMVFIFPHIGTSLQFINLPQVQAAAVASSGQSGLSFNFTTIYYAIIAITIFAGFSGFLLSSLFVGAESILWGIIQFAASPSGAAAGAVANQAGVAPIIPGIDIPLFAGIIAIATLLIIHEFSHGILARRAKVKLKEIGLLVFGFIPIGGYVEPDEKMVEKLDNIKQTKIFSAGVAANFIATIILFILMFATMIYIFPIVHITYQYKVVIAGIEPNYPANNILRSGMQILRWNNVSMANLTTLNATSAALISASSSERPNKNISVITNMGAYSIKAVPSPSNSSRGVIGVSLAEQYAPAINGTYASAVYFIFTVFALSMLLNFFVGILNFAPIPGFDGWRIYYANIKNKKFINFVGALIIILIVINILPWFFYL